MAEQNSIHAEIEEACRCFGTDEATAQRIVSKLRVIEGRFRQGDYRVEGPDTPFGPRTSWTHTPRMYQDAYHAVAKEIVKRETPAEVVEEIIPAFLTSFAANRHWLDSKLEWVKKLCEGPIIEWQGHQLAMIPLATDPFKNTISATFDPKADKSTLGRAQLQKARSNLRRAFVEPLLIDKGGWSIERWALEADVNDHTARDYLSGKTTPYTATMVKLARALGVSVKSFPK